MPPESTPAATETAASTPAATSAPDRLFAVGQQVKFKGYAEGTTEDQKVFQPGDILELVSDGPDTGGVENYNVRRLTDGSAASCYFDEIEKYEAPAEAPADGKKPKKEKKPAEPKAPKEAPPPPPPLVLTEAVQNLVSDDPSKTLEAAETLSKQVDVTEFTLGGLLAKIKRDGTYATILDTEGKPVYPVGNDGFNAYAQARLSCGSRKAAYLASIYEKYSAIGATEEDVGKVGWTKASLLLPVITKENKDELLGFAADNNKDSVSERVKTIQVNAASTGSGGGAPAPRGVKKVFTTVLYNNDAATYEAILEAAKGRLSAEDQKDKNVLSKASLLMATEWSQFAAAAAASSAPAPAQTVAQPAETVAATA